MRWVEDTAPSCEACRTIYSNRTPPETPPCSECRPAILPGNEEVIDVYLMTRGQFITAGMGTVVDINIPAVKIAMDLFRVKDQKGCLQKVRHLFQEFRPKEKK